MRKTIIEVAICFVWFGWCFIVIFINILKFKFLVQAIKRGGFRQIFIECTLMEVEELNQMSYTLMTVWFGV